VRRTCAPALVALLASALIAGCGAEDFANEPRAAAPIETTARLGPGIVEVSPDSFGAGIVNITVANLSDHPASLILKAASGKTAASSGTIAPQAVTTIKTDLKQGNYEAVAGGASNIRSDTIKVGPERASSQNDLLQP
jgi:hypothetical protein